MEYKVNYNGQETNDFDTLASWFQELKDENERLKEENEQHRDDYIRLKLGYDEFKQRNRDLESERSKTKEILKRYCGDYVVGPMPTIVGAIIDDYFYQQAETEYQVKALQKAEITIEKLNNELVEYADKVEKLEKRLWNPNWSRIIDKLNEIIDKEAPNPVQQRKVYTNVEDEIWDKHNYLTRSLRARNVLNDVKNKHIRELENKVNELDVTNRKLKLENEKLIYVQGDNAIEHAVEITGLKVEISALKTILEEQKNKRSPRWPSDVMKIGTLENKVDKLTKENEYLKYKNQLILSEPCRGGLSIVAENRRLREEVESLKGQNEVLKIKNAYPICPIFEANSKEAANSIFGVDGTIHKLREENNKLKRTLEFCQREASFAREHAHNVEVNAERIRKGLD